MTDDWKSDDDVRNDGIHTLARLETGQPVVFEHLLGKGRVLTFLTGAGRRWSNWPIAPAAPGFVVMHLLIHQHLQRATDSVELRELSEPLRLEWPIGRFTDVVEVFLPEAGPDDEPVAETLVRLQATPVQQSASTPAAMPESNAVEPPVGAPDESQADGLLTVTVTQAERPGIYRVRRFDAEGRVNDTAIALNVPTSESALTIADAELITQQAELDHVRILEANSANSLGGSAVGRELRWLLLGLLIATLVAEQLLALRLSYHPEVAR